MPLENAARDKGSVPGSDWEAEDAGESRGGEGTVGRVSVAGGSGGDNRPDHTSDRAGEKAGDRAEGETGNKAGDKTGRVTGSESESRSGAGGAKSPNFGTEGGQTGGTGRRSAHRAVHRAKKRTAKKPIHEVFSRSTTDAEQTMYSHPQQGAGQEAQKLRQQAGQWLRDLRKSRNLSQRDLARLVQVEYYTFISQIEAGKGRIPPERYTIWADALGVEPRDFVKTILRYYDPITYEILFNNGEAPLRIVEPH